MSNTEQSQKHSITLKGSSEIVSEFFNYGINSILYQRGVYPQETFKSVQHYGIPLLVSTDEHVKKYLDIVLGQVQSWVAENKAERLVLVLKDMDTNDVVERWEFKVEGEKSAEQKADSNGPVGTKELKKIQSEIRDVMRQVTASVSFLPLLECICCFEVLVYTRTSDSEQPSEWLESEALLIPNSETVNLRSFSTSLHKVEALVSYKVSD